MKKKYVTPMIEVEHYELTQTIAACSIKIGALDSQCVLTDSDSTNAMKQFAAARNWFLSGHCEEAATGTDPYDGFCYHTNAQAAFNS